MRSYVNGFVDQTGAVVVVVVVVIIGKSWQYIDGNGSFCVLIGGRIARDEIW